MAIKQEIWDKAKAMFEGGATLSTIQHKTKINGSTVSKKAKSEGWEKGVNSTIIENEINNIVEKSTLNQQQLDFHNQEVERKVKHLQFIHNATLKNASVMMGKVGSETTHQEHKFVQETINKAGEALGVLDKGAAVQISNTNAQQTVIDKKDYANVRRNMIEQDDC